MYSAIAANKRNTIFIMAAFIGLITAIGYAVSLVYGNTSITFWVLGESRSMRCYSISLPLSWRRQ